MSFFSKFKGGDDGSNNNNSNSSNSKPDTSTSSPSWFSSISNKLTIQGGDSSATQPTSSKPTKNSSKQDKRRQGWRQSNRDLWADEEDEIEDTNLKKYYQYKKDRAKERDANENSIFTQVQRAFNERGEVLTQVEEQFHGLASNASKMAGEAQNTAAKESAKKTLGSWF
ncbi:hypothetical protein E3P92_01370 [Wallemia ichthyophaga]|uniref:Uncharacterized protein n=1 Tax=Wallemia ichthyophaga TaxID=245174 RepID=A0A4T0JAF5_WALIC|nr:hypothetical protein E3P91_01079 [Wallemia ichthyophaga]TIA92656.1 hypothetical protein E3P97_01384 [Wallemia ichthyophaga]TIA98959.1 hypothetical protein E3P96_03042 [Wallemia ichthyophaga]TIB01773.1 hypothetical protein E3P95_01220 [Wallemia ichthyophaga]TIB02752.1 hypothetical protein E3P94_01352 [Wallemia ichthyophaga]